MAETQRPMDADPTLRLGTATAHIEAVLRYAERARPAPGWLDGKLIAVPEHLLEALRTFVAAEERHHTDQQAEFERLARTLPAIADMAPVRL